MSCHFKLITLLLAEDVSAHSYGSTLIVKWTSEPTSHALVALRPLLRRHRLQYPAGYDVIEVTKPGGKPLCRTRLEALLRFWGTAPAMRSLSQIYDGDTPDQALRRTLARAIRVTKPRQSFDHAIFASHESAVGWIEQNQLLADDTGLVSAIRASSIGGCHEVPIL